ncbi:MAG TPA: alcohol dehydrogenase catalytic domain-containing protein [Solirubrobacteraceae bacterium]|nr:alcohol dehydrogenase catalytic domain-containing protein [Solirubrobacteraceae bacterium]
MKRSNRRRPYGPLRHYAGMLSPSAATAMRTLLERDVGRRLRRLSATAGDRAMRARRRPRMRALLAAPGARLRWREVAAPPPPGPLGAVVHPIASSTCDMDCPVALGATQILLPLHLGHECVAEVLAVGEQVQNVRPGDRVIVPFEINCGTCEPCRRGHTASCASVPPVSMYGFGLAAGQWGGAFSDELAVPYADAMLVRLPEGVDPVAAASVADNVCDAYRHIGPHLPALLEEDPEAEVLILAAHRARSLFTPSCPLYTGMIALAMGARNVYFADSRPWVRAHAERLGMHALHPRALRRRGPFPLVADVSVDGLPHALAATAPDGVCSSSGGLHRSAQIPMLQMYIRNTTLHVGRAHVRALMPAVLDLMARGHLHPEQVTTTVASLEDAPRVLREHFLAGESVKTVLTAG